MLGTSVKRSPCLDALPKLCSCTVQSSSPSPWLLHGLCSRLHSGGSQVFPLQLACFLLGTVEKWQGAKILQARGWAAVWLNDLISGFLLDNRQSSMKIDTEVPGSAGWTIKWIDMIVGSGWRQSNCYHTQYTGLSGAENHTVSPMMGEFHDCHANLVAWCHGQPAGSRTSLWEK